MIVDTIENLGLYRGLSPRIHSGLQFLKTVQIDRFAKGREELDGSDLFAVFETYLTRTAAEQPFEAHNRYVDIQFVLDGQELIRVAPRDELTEHTAYDPEADVALYEPAAARDIVLRSGMFLILFPHEAHLPQLAAGPSSRVYKIVVKVAL